MAHGRACLRSHRPDVKSQSNWVFAAHQLLLMARNRPAALVRQGPLVEANSRLPRQLLTQSGKGGALTATWFRGLNLGQRTIEGMHFRPGIVTPCINLEHRLALIYA